MANIDRRIDEIERQLANTKSRQESTHDDLLRSFARRRFLDGLKYLMEFLPAAERQPVHKFWTFLINPRAWNRNHDATEPDPVPLEIEHKIFEIAHHGGYSYLRSVGLLLDDPGLLARAADLRLMDIPDLSRIPFYGGKTPPGVHHDPDLKYRDWQAFLEFFKSNGYGTFGPRTDFGPDHRFYDLMGYELVFRENISRWLDVYGPEVVGEFIDLSRVNSILETGE